MSQDVATSLGKPIFGKGQTISYTGTSGVIANPLPGSAVKVYVGVTSAAFVTIGNTSSVAAVASSDLWLPAGGSAVIDLQRNSAPGTPQDLWVAAVQDTAGGNLRVMPLAD